MAIAIPKQQESEIDGIIGIITLPPIRVTLEVYAALKAESESSGLILQAVVRKKLEESIKETQ